MQQVGWAEKETINWRKTAQPFPVIEQAKLEKEAFRKTISDSHIQ